MTLRHERGKAITAYDGETWEQVALQNSYYASETSQAFLDKLMYKQPKKNEDCTATFSKIKKRKLVWCQVCKQHKSRNLRTCTLCKQKRALPSCDPQHCWIQFHGKKQGGACRDCFKYHLDKEFPCEVADKINEFLGKEYGFIKQKQKVPDELMKLVNLICRQTM